MATESQKSKEQPSTYFVQDRSNKDEITRLHIQDQLLTKGMGGVLPEQDDPARFQHVLDVGCGTGDWLIALAQQLPTATLVGVDVSQRMMEQARHQAQAAGVGDRVEFRVMDALRTLDFPRHSFDLVNQRLGTSYLRTWDWASLLQEYRQVTRAGGVIRITEDDIPTSNLPASRALYELLTAAFGRAGHTFSSEERGGITSSLKPIMHQAGLLNLQTRAYQLEFRAGTPEGQFFAEDTKHVFRTAAPFLRKWTTVPPDYESLYQQALRELQQPDFVATWHLLTCWGTNPHVVEKQVFD